MKKRLAMRSGIAALAVALAASAASAQQPRDQRGPFSVAGGIGFMQGPDGFVLGFEGEYELGSGFSLGPAMQLGLDDDFTMVSPVVFGRYRVDLVQLGAPRNLARLHPYGQLGLGFTYMDVDTPDRVRGNPDDDDVEFLMNFGFGAEYDLTNEISVGSRMLFNVLPDDVFDENFYYSWEVVTARYQF